MASIARIRRNPKIELVDDERLIGNGVIVTLRQGWSWERGVDNRVRGEDSVHAMNLAVKNEIYSFSGPYEA